MATLKFGPQLPPLPLKSDNTSTNSNPNSNPQSRISSATSRKLEPPIIQEEGEPALNTSGSVPVININKNNLNIRKVVNDRREIYIQEFLKKGQIDFGSVSDILNGTPWNANLTPYSSRYRFTPTIDLETKDEEEEEEVLYKLEIRGWRIPNETIESLNMILPNLPNLNTICFWNNSLNDHQFQIISGFSLIGNLRELSLDNNPGVSETLWASLFVDDSFLRVVSLRGNGITDVGAKGIANALKTNRTLFSLNLFDNKIQKTGAEYFGETLKANSTLQTLSLGKNNIGDDGLLSLITGLSNIPLSVEEVQLRKKLLTEVDRIKNDIEEVDATGKKKVNRRNTSATKTIIGNEKDKDDKKKTVGVKAVKKLEPTPPVRGVAKTPDDPKTKKLAPAANAKKGAAVVTPGPTPLAGGKAKKPKAEDTKEEVEELTDISNSFEPMFEVNNQWYVLGNRSLNSLNVSANDITELGLKNLLTLITEQDSTSEQATEGSLGLFRIVLSFNAIATDNSLLHQLNSILSLRNPFFEPVDENENGLAGDNEEFGDNDIEDGQQDEAP